MDTINILLPYDDSNNSKRALDYAIKWSKILKAKITIVHVISYHGSIAKIVEPYKDKVIDHVSDMLSRAQNEALKSGVKSEQKILYGSVIEEILKIIKKNDFNLAVIGKRGSNKFTTTMGSVSNALINNSKIPVIMVP